jgi:hypothetical protein
VQFSKLDSESQLKYDREDQMFDVFDVIVWIFEKLVHA